MTASLREAVHANRQADEPLFDIDYYRQSDESLANVRQALSKPEWYRALKRQIDLADSHIATLEGRLGPAALANTDWLTQVTPDQSRILSALLYAYPSFIDITTLAMLVHDDKTEASTTVQINTLRKKYGKDCIVNVGYGVGYRLNEAFYEQQATQSEPYDDCGQFEYRLMLRERRVAYLETCLKTARVDLQTYDFGDSLSRKERLVVLTLLEAHPKGLSLQALARQVDEDMTENNLRVTIAHIRAKIKHENLIRNDYGHFGYRLSEEYYQRVISTKTSK